MNAVSSGVTLPVPYVMCYNLQIKNMNKVYTVGLLTSEVLDVRTNTM